jgi:hypothetical protein
VLTIRDPTISYPRWTLLLAVLALIVIVTAGVCYVPTTTATTPTTRETTTYSTTSFSSLGNGCCTSVTSTFSSTTTASYSIETGIGYQTPPLVPVGPDGQTVSLSIGAVKDCSSGCSDTATVQGNPVQTDPLSVIATGFSPDALYFLGITQGAIPNLNSVSYQPLQPSVQSFVTNGSGDAVIRFPSFPAQNVFGYPMYFGVWSVFPTTSNYNSVIADVEHTWSPTPTASVTMTVFSYDSITGHLNATISIAGFTMDAGQAVAFQFDDGDGGNFVVSANGDASWHSSEVFGGIAFCPGLHWIDVSGPDGGWAAASYLLSR